MIPDSPNNGIKDSNDIVAAFMAYLAIKGNSSSNPEAYRILSNIEATEWGGYTQMAYAYLNAESTREEVAKVFEQFGIKISNSENILNTREDSDGNLFENVQELNEHLTEDVHKRTLDNVISLHEEGLIKSEGLVSFEEYCLFMKRMQGWTMHNMGTKIFGHSFFKYMDKFWAKFLAPYTSIGASLDNPSRKALLLKARNRSRLGRRYWKYCRKVQTFSEKLGVSTNEIYQQQPDECGVSDTTSTHHDIPAFYDKIFDLYKNGDLTIDELIDHIDVKFDLDLHAVHKHVLIEWACNDFNDRINHKKSEDDHYEEEVYARLQKYASPSDNPKKLASVCLAYIRHVHTNYNIIWRNLKALYDAKNKDNKYEKHHEKLRKKVNNAIMMRLRWIRESLC